MNFKTAIAVAILTTVVHAETADSNDEYDYSSVADRIHKEVQVQPVDPAGEIRERVKPADPYQDILNDVYGGSQTKKDK